MRFLFITSACIVLLSISGCGADASSAADPPPVGNNPPPAPAPIEGVATPSSVAVVTATNAQ